MFTQVYVCHHTALFGEMLVCRCKSRAISHG